MKRKRPSPQSARTFISVRIFYPTTCNKSTLAFRSRYIPERPWIISLSNMLVEAEPQLAPTGAWVWRTIVFTPLQQLLDWLAIKPNNEQALLGCSGELGRSATGTKSNAMFVYRCNSQGLGAIRPHYKRALRGCWRELLRFKGVRKYTVIRFAVNM